MVKKGAANEAKAHKEYKAAQVFKKAMKKAEGIILKTNMSESKLINSWGNKVKNKIKLVVTRILSKSKKKNLRTLGLPILHKS